MGLNANLYQLSAATCCLSIALGSAPLNAAEPAEGCIVSPTKKSSSLTWAARTGCCRSAPSSCIGAWSTHPYSNKPIVDRFPIGSVTPPRSVRKLSIVTRWNQLTRAPQRGDIAVFRLAATH